MKDEAASALRDPRQGRPGQPLVGLVRRPASRRRRPRRDRPCRAGHRPGGPARPARQGPRPGPAAAVGPPARPGPVVRQRSNDASTSDTEPSASDPKAAAAPGDQAAARPPTGRPRRPADPVGAAASGPRRRASRMNVQGNRMIANAVSTAISVSGLVKSFGRTRALDGLDMTVRTGEVHGFLGPNGAGKPTTIRVLLGLLRPDAGRAALLGGDPWRDAVALHRRLAYVPGDVSLWPSLSGGGVIDLLGGRRGGRDPGRRAELLERFELDPAKKARAYSKGNRQKVALVAALASDGELLVLNEPTSGLDPLMETVFQDCILEERKAGGTVLLSSHILAEAEKLCDRVSIIRAGRIVESGTLSDLRHLTRTSIQAELRRPPTGLGGVAGAHGLESEEPAVLYQVDTGQLDATLRRLTDYGVRSLVSQPPTLEELFLRHYQTGNQTPSPATADGRRARPEVDRGADSWARGAG